MLIGIIGPKQHGKSTVAKIIAEAYNFEIREISKPIVESFCEAFDVTPGFVQEWKTKEMEAAPGFDNSMRSMLEEWGSVHRFCRQSYWVDLALPSREQKVDAVIPNIRNEDELTEVKRHPGSLLLYVCKPTFTRDQQASPLESLAASIHQQIIARESNASLPGRHGNELEQIDEIIWNSGSLAELEFRVREILDERLRG